MNAVNTSEIILTVFFRDVLTSYESGKIYVLRFQHITVNARDYYYDIRITTKIYADSHAGVRMAHLNEGEPSLREGVLSLRWIWARRFTYEAN